MSSDSPDAKERRRTVASIIVKLIGRTHRFGYLVEYLHGLSDKELKLLIDEFAVESNAVDIANNFLGDIESRMIEYVSNHRRSIQDAASSNHLPKRKLARPLGYIASKARDPEFGPPVFSPLTLGPLSNTNPPSGEPNPAVANPHLTDKVVLNSTSDTTDSSINRSSRATQNLEQLESQAIDKKTIFTFPNGKIGCAYQGVLAVLPGAGITPTSIQKVSIPAGLGLVWDDSLNALVGTPQRTGDWVLPIIYLVGSGQIRIGSSTLVVNANPKDLWKDLPSDEGGIYAKPDADSQVIHLPDTTLVAASKRGRSHAHNGGYRDDDFFLGHIGQAGWRVLMVADGAGSAQFSRKGSALVVGRAGEYLMDALGGEAGQALAALIKTEDISSDAVKRKIKDRLYELFGKAAWAGYRAIEAEADSNKAVPRDYATTLLCSVLLSEESGTFVGSFWLGDGAIAAVGGGKAVLLGEPDGGDFAGQTCFLDKQILGDAKEIWNRIRFDIVSNEQSIVLMTDGISDPKFETDENLKSDLIWSDFWDEIQPLLASSTPQDKMLSWLDFFIAGHHDDRTIAVLFPQK